MQCSCKQNEHEAWRSKNLQLPHHKVLKNVATRYHGMTDWLGLRTKVLNVLKSFYIFERWLAINYNHAAKKFIREAKGDEPA